MIYYYSEKNNYYQEGSMKIYGDENNSFILKELGQRVKDIRINQVMTQKDLCEKAGVSFSTVVRIENGEGINTDNLLKIMRALNLLQNWDLLIPEQDQTPDEILKEKNKRKRVFKIKEEKVKEWTWGDEEKCK